MNTEAEIEASKAATATRRAANARRAKSRQLGLKNLVKEEEACSHKLKLAKGLIIVLHRENCPRCLRRRMRYYRARSRAAEGELKKRDRAQAKPSQWADLAYDGATFEEPAAVQTVGTKAT